VLPKIECGQQHVRPLPYHLEGLLDLCHDLHCLHLSDVWNIPYLDRRLSDGVYPILAEAIVLTLHEHQDVARTDKRGRRLLPRGGCKAFKAAFAENALPLSQLLFGEIFDAHIQTLATTLRPSTTGRYRGVARHFLSYLQMDFPQVRGLSELRRDPHLLGWFRCLGEQDPSHRRSSSSRRISLCGRSSNNSSAPLMTGTPNCPTSYLVRFLTCVSRLSGPLYDPARRAAIAALPVTSSPISKWISPQLLHLSGLRRDPHLLGWFRRL